MRILNKIVRRKVKCNHARRKTYFQKGNKCAVKCDESLNAAATDAEATPGTSSDTSQGTTVIDLQSNAECRSSITRFKTSKAADILTARRRTDYQDTVPYKLRPAKEAESVNLLIGSSNDVSENENIIVNVRKLQEMIKILNAHSCSESNLEMQIADRCGLCVSTRVECKNCKFMSEPISLYNTMKSKRGPDAGCLNNALLLPVMKSRVGINDLLLVLSCLNIQTPDCRGLQRKVNVLSDKIEELSKYQLQQNQNYVRHIQDLAGASGIDVEYDVSYSSRPQSGCETATQCFAPLIEQTTTKHLPIDIRVGNKLCSKKNCKHDTNECKRNYSVNDSITLSESKLLKESLQSISESQTVKITSITTDASAQISKTVREFNIRNKTRIRHYKCFVHKMRSLHKALKALKLKTKLQRGYEKGIYIQKLASSLRIRTRQELTRFLKRHSSEEQYLIHAESSTNNMLACFQGRHQNCRRLSLVCNAHLKCHTTKHLPYGKYVQLQDSDINSIQKVISKYLNKDSLKEMAQLKTSNQCESLHSRLFSLAPKNTVWTRNFTGLCYSVAHNASLGSGTSLVCTARAIGLPIAPGNPFVWYALNRDKMAKYHNKRKSSYQYKRNRFMNRKKLSSRRALQTSMYADNLQINQEHAYGVNLNK